MDYTRTGNPDIFPEATIFTFLHPTDSETDSASEGEDPSVYQHGSS